MGGDLRLDDSVLPRMAFTPNFRKGVGCCCCFSVWRRCCVDAYRLSIASSDARLVVGRGVVKGELGVSRRV